MLVPDCHLLSTREPCPKRLKWRESTNRSLIPFGFATFYPSSSPLQTSCTPGERSMVARAGAARNTNLALINNVVPRPTAHCSTWMKAGEVCYPHFGSAPPASHIRYHRHMVSQFLVAASARRPVEASWNKLLPQDSSHTASSPPPCDHDSIPYLVSSRAHT